ncbi:membrane protein insertion efficiency factor YidD [Laspinema palackyanum]|uniref:membrane protein insertion efficiency factor YidD n=1 Tax=Laspinema palackyanum TaxID=3231601 RepID=UPI00349F80C3
MRNSTLITGSSIFHKSQTLIAATFSLSDLGIRNLLILWIHWYQKNLSPRKGYSCAYRSLHHGESCSCYVKNILSEQNLLTSISLANQRFSECAQAEKILRIRSAENENSRASDSPGLCGYWSYAITQSIYVFALPIPGEPTWIPYLLTKFSGNTDAEKHQKSFNK